MVLNIDANILTKLAPHYTGARAERQATNIRLAGPFFPAALARHDITTLLRKAHFLAQVCEESWGFSDMKEEASGEEYEGRADLGNTSPGDGPLYKGRGFIQLTGKANYRTYGKALGLDLLRHPELAENPRNAVESACEYWTKRHLNPLADKDDLSTITRRINGRHMRGLAKRAAYLVQAKRLLAMELMSEAVTMAEQDAKVVADRLKAMW